MRTVRGVCFDTGSADKIADQTVGNHDSSLSNGKKHINYYFSEKKLDKMMRFCNNAIAVVVIIVIF
ncbi:TPA: hypothetical protein EYO63_18355 [Candidatus Poribacteria bacterium]|nr:hypothetical protein [Candidatus Poribacteria bacterium]